MERKPGGQRRVKVCFIWSRSLEDNTKCGSSLYGAETWRTTQSVDLLYVEQKPGGQTQSVDLLYKIQYVYFILNSLSIPSYRSPPPDILMTL
jgi:hypothetical protein